MNGSVTRHPPAEPPEPPLDRRVIRLPDGRELTYYRFPETPPRPATPPAQER